MVSQEGNETSCKKARHFGQAFALIHGGYASFVYRWEAAGQRARSCYPPKPPMATELYYLFLRLNMKLLTMGN